MFRGVRIDELLDSTLIFISSENSNAIFTEPSSRCSETSGLATRELNVTAPFVKLLFPVLKKQQ